MRIRIFIRSFQAEVGGDVGDGAVGLAAEHALVGARGGEGAEVGDVGTDFDVVELLTVEGMGDVLAAAVPRHFVVRVMLVDIYCQHSHFMRGGIAPHETDACDSLSMLRHHAVEGCGVEWQACVRPQVGTMAAGTPTWASCNVDGQCRLVGDFLKDYVGVEILEQFLKVKTRK